MDANFTSLEKSISGQDLYQSHKNVVSYWSPWWDEIEVYYDNLAGNMWTPEEKAFFQRKKKAPVVINDLKPLERTILGLFIQNKYDIKFSPREEVEASQSLSDVLQKLYAWTAYSQDWAHKDIETVRQAWCGGAGYQEIYMKVVPGKEPIMCTNNVNPFSLAWDPESRDLITREDAQFVDRDTWVSFPDLQDMWPDKILEEDGLTNQGSESYQQSKTYADRTAESLDNKNNRYKVTERYYKVRKRQWFATDGKSKIEIKNPDDRAKYEQEGFQIFSDSEEFLYLAIICPAWRIGEYLYNGEYHCQPRDVFSGKIIFPFVELIAESINGVPSGFVKHLVPLNRLTNSAVSNMFHAQKHASSTALMRKKKLFGEDEAQAQNFDKNHSDADRVFIVSDQADLGVDIGPVPKGTVSPDTDKTLNIGQDATQRISSTPPAIQGVTENAGDSGILNSQRIEQSFVQLQPFIANIKHFLKRRAELVYFYWREYYTYPMKIKIIGDKDPANPDQSHVEINQEQPQVDWQGQPTGAIEKINDINSAKYDTDIEDSYQSPTFRAKRLQQISEMMNKSQNLSPTMYQALFSEFSKSSDMAQETKDLISADIKRSQDAASQPPQPELPKPPSFSFSLKGEDLQTMAGLELVRAANLLPPDVIDKLEAQVMAQNNSGASGNNNANPVDPSAPFKIETHNADMELKKARLNGIHLENAQRMQKVATNEAEVEADLNDPRGLMPIASKILGRHPTAFEPLGVR